jgi:2-polyprenyl-6-hydroxyphenyl methylase/3-demethylubiquinone-9 3-methyltransferase
MAAHLPDSGPLLDAGCGHGLFALTLALGGPRREVLGIDHDPKRVEAARRAASGIPNLRFRYGDYQRVPGSRWAAVAFLDCLHYLPHPRQDAVLRRAVRKLRRGGVLLFREMDPEGGFASAWNSLHEKVMTRFGFTRAEGLHFRTRSGWKEAARKAGVTVRERPLATFPFADILFWGTKP